MLFCSQQFLAFFGVVFLAYWMLPWHRARTGLLLLASFVFYASWNHWLALIIGASATLDWLLARGLEASTAPRWRRLLLVTSVTVNLGVLSYFKYANFFLGSLEDALHAVGSSASLPVLRVILPIGISFYTFEAISYTADVYLGRIRAERNLAHFLLFILFFPHLVAGPVVRARDFLPQVGRRKHWSWLRIQVGAQFFLMGLFKKLAIADRMALYADPVFADPGQYTTNVLWLAVLAYALQIYCDFSGYTDMALGTAHLLGFRLVQNFNLPYLATNVAEFWRRWHISLSSWLRDYLFIPLGGSRGQRTLLYRNLLVTMALGGLWHGASWTFVIWGVLHGLLLIGHRVFRDFCEARPILSRAFQTAPGTVLRVATTFLCVCLGWVFFRAPSLEAAGLMLQRMAVPHAGQGMPLRLAGLLLTVAVIALCHGLAWRDTWKRLLLRLPGPLVGVGYAAVLAVALLLAPDAGKAFIYFLF
jgi:alginate O-acetyltransferase complex protein AlgI